MPKLLTKTAVLQGRAQVVSYERDPSVFYYRELLKGTKTYRTKRLASTTIESAQLEAVDAYAELRVPSEAPTSVFNSPQQVTITKGAKQIKGVIKDYLKELRSKVTARQIKQTTYDVAENVIYKLVLTYFIEKDIATTKDIDINTFKNYVFWRQENAEGRWNNLKNETGVTKLTLHKELSQVRKWVSDYLLPNKLIKPELAAAKNFIEYPTIKAEDLLANPAINEDDWKVILSYIRNHWIIKKGQPNRQDGIWARTMLHHWVLLCKNTGARPEELMKLKWKDIEYEDVGRFSKTAKEQHIEEMKERGIAFDEEDKSLGMVKKEIAHVVLRSSKTGAPRVSSCNSVETLERWKAFQLSWSKQNKVQYNITPNSFVWECPYKQGKTLTYSRVKQLWGELRSEIQPKLKGHIFSDEPYTLYSLRSTFIEDALLEGKDVFLVAKASGHSVEMLVKHYERIDPRRRAKEMTDFEYGSKPKSKRRSSI